MAEEKVIARETTVFDDHNIIREVKKAKDKYVWSEVSVKGDKEQYHIGLYVIEGDPYHRQWLEHNQQYVVIMSQPVYEEETFPERVVTMFDVLHKQFVKGTSDELKRVYDYSFHEKGAGAK